MIIQLLNQKNPFLMQRLMPEQLPVGDSVYLDDVSELSLSIEEVLDSQLVKPTVIIKVAEGACQNVL